MGRRAESIGDDGEIEESRGVIAGDDDLIKKPQLAVENVVDVSLKLLSRRLKHFVTRKCSLMKGEWEVNVTKDVVVHDKIYNSVADYNC